MNTKQKVRQYFIQEINRTHEDAKFYSKEASVSDGNTKKYLEDRAWFSGVLKPAMLKDIEKDILKLI